MIQRLEVPDLKSGWSGFESQRRYHIQFVRSGIKTDVIGGSSNGRTAVSKSADAGSIPVPLAICRYDGMKTCQAQNLVCESTWEFESPYRHERSRSSQAPPWVPVVALGWGGRSLVVSRFDPNAQTTRFSGWRHGRFNDEM